ncbi:MAG: hypothetical protein M3Q49_20380 [Actinomycetota bacterium]|nr:hypothetical protein [Actinomycetota bacterium]
MTVDRERARTESRMVARLIVLTKLGALAGAELHEAGAEEEGGSAIREELDELQGGEGGSY